MNLANPSLQVKPFSWQDEAAQIWQSWATDSELTPFAFPTFQKIFSHFVAASYQAVMVGVWRETELIAVLSGHRQAETFWLAGMPPLFTTETITDYGDLVVAPSVSQELGSCQLIWQSLKAYLAQAGLTKLILSNLRPDSYLAQGLQLRIDPLTGRGLLPVDSEWSSEISAEDVSPYLLLPADWETYLSQLRKKDRSELRRKLKRLATAEPSYSFEAGSTSNVADFVRLHRLSDPAKAQFMTTEMVAVFDQLATAEYEGGWQWQFGFLSLAGQRVAAVAYFIKPGAKILLYNSGYDPAFSQLSVGLGIKAHLVKVALETGCREYDFLRGSERYKYDLGAQTRQLYRVYLQVI
jgi:hypothetical protein